MRKTHTQIILFIDEFFLLLKFVVSSKFLDNSL